MFVFGEGFFCYFQLAGHGVRYGPCTLSGTPVAYLGVSSEAGVGMIRSWEKAKAVASIQRAVQLTFTSILTAPSWHARNVTESCIVHCGAAASDAGSRRVSVANGKQTHN